MISHTMLHLVSDVVHLLLRISCNLSGGLQGTLSVLEGFCEAVVDRVGVVIGDYLVNASATEEDG